jgi:hypothetical protein
VTTPTVPTAVLKEADWLATTAADSLPVLLGDGAGGGGPFDVVQGYWPRTAEYRKAGLYLTRPAFQNLRFGAHRKIRRHQFLLRVLWPIGSTSVGSGLWEAEQTALDVAVDAVVDRIVAYDGDKTHGGRFLSVAEAPEAQPISVRYADPARATGGGRVELTVEITYQADDNDYTA